MSEQTNKFTLQPNSAHCFVCGMHSPVGLKVRFWDNGADEVRATYVVEEKYQGYECFKIEMIPKPEAGVVWGKIITWISKNEFLQLRADYYDEDGYLVQTMSGTEIKKMDGRLIPTVWEMQPEDKPEQRTVFIYEKIDFDITIKKSFFSQQNMKRVR